MSIQFFAVNRALKELDKLGMSKVSKEVDGGKLLQFARVLHQAKGSWFVSNKQCKKLEVKVTALSYRLGTSTKLDTPDQAFLEQLKSAALAWKQKQVSFGDNPILTPEDEEKLKELSCYAEAFPDVDLDRFFTWTMRNKQSVDLFVQFPHIVKRINECLLAARVGTFGGLELVDKNGEKDVTLLIESKPVSILNEKESVTFKSGFQTRIKDIFESFKNKNLKEGIFTYLENEGVIPFDTFAMNEVDASGKVVPLDVSDKDSWFKSLRMKAHLTKEQAAEKFGFDCDGTNYVLTVVCTRQIKELDTYGSHSFIRLAIPDGTGGYLYTYGWGKFSKEYPQNPIDGASFFFMPKMGGIQYIDNNEIYSNREKKEIHYSLDADKGKACLESLRQDIEDAQADRLVFQILRWNCSDWVIKKVKNFVGKTESELMDISYLELSPKGFLGSILKILRSTADWFRQVTLNVIAFIGFGWYGISITKADGTTKTYRVLSTPPWGDDRKNRFHHPGKVFA